MNRPKPLPRIRHTAPVPVPRRVVHVVVAAVEPPLATEDPSPKITNANPSQTSPPLSETRFNSAGRQRGFQIGKSLLAMKETVNTEISDNISRSSEDSNTISIDSDRKTENDFEIENLSIFDVKENSGKRHKRYSKHLYGNQVEINDMDQNKKYEEIFASKRSSGGSIPSIHSITSLRSLDSVPTFLGNGSIKKWDNVQHLDGISIDSSMVKSNWAVGESDAGMFKLFNTPKFYF